jgi:hypothetical protein
MIFISNKKKVKIGKIIAATKHIATHSIGVSDTETQIENMNKIIENMCELAFEIGGERFAEIDVPSAEYLLQEKLKTRRTRE